MFGSRSKAFFLGLMAISIGGPLLLILWNPQVGGILMLLGLVIAARCINLIRSMHMTNSVDDTTVLMARQNRARTIFVSLLDEQGQPLPTEIAQARLATAYQDAGPRDTVIGVQRKVD
jgi:hypothetical protein